MARLSKKVRQVMDFFINPDTGRRTYNSLCRKCCKDCKQSYKSLVVSCHNYKSKKSKAVKALREEGKDVI